MKIAWLVDDDVDMARAIKLLLSLVDFEAIHYTGARDAAKEMMRGKLPDLLFLDISMPEVSGMDMLEFIRRRQEFNRLPIIMLTSEASDALVDRALEMGADAYVTKPATLEELENAIRDAFRTHGRRR
jgi:DNA-binding response OmpR family regulator